MVSYEAYKLSDSRVNENALHMQMQEVNFFASLT